MKAIEHSVPMRTAIFYTPVGLMTSRNIAQNGNGHLLKDAAEYIDTVFSFFHSEFHSKKAVIHTGNLGQHATEVNKHLHAMGYQTTLHRQGELKQTIEEFLVNRTQFLLVVSAEYGLDFKKIDLQFVLKVPYAAMDERLRALERKIGGIAFRKFYSMDALNRLVQQCGRVGRGANSFGCTFILDKKFKDLYVRYSRDMPEWFTEKLVWEG